MALTTLVFLSSPVVWKEDNRYGSGPGLAAEKMGDSCRAALKLCEWTSAGLPNRTIVVSRTLQNYYTSRYAKEPD